MIKDDARSDAAKLRLLVSAASGSHDEDRPTWGMLLGVLLVFGLVFGAVVWL